ncbi:hypothetical protein M9Y10_042858 [Tritrichomonas musculus]|uniref:Uncharacterized protein n=1 Tax=Tritrichomonas musculus TaxID=1915356 RepID=A0ABR2JY21_9EUKA
MSILCNEKQVDISSIHQLDDEESTTSDEDGSFDNYEKEEEYYADFAFNPSQKAPNEKNSFLNTRYTAYSKSNLMVKSLNIVFNKFFFL